MREKGKGRNKEMGSETRQLGERDEGGKRGKKKKKTGEESVEGGKEKKTGNFINISKNFTNPSP